MQNYDEEEQICLNRLHKFFSPEIYILQFYSYHFCVNYSIKVFLFAILFPADTKYIYNNNNKYMPFFRQRQQS